MVVKARFHDSGLAVQEPCQLRTCPHKTGGRELSLAKRKPLDSTHLRSSAQTRSQPSRSPRSLELHALLRHPEPET
jgi:hypothetical protein